MIGREVRVNGSAHVIGVLPDGYIGPMGQVDFFFAFDRGPVVANPSPRARAQWLARRTVETWRRQDAAAREIDRDLGRSGSRVPGR